MGEINPIAQVTSGETAGPGNADRDGEFRTVPACAPAPKLLKKIKILVRFQALGVGPPVRVQASGVKLIKKLTGYKPYDIGFYKIIERTKPC